MKPGLTLHLTVWAAMLGLFLGVSMSGEAIPYTFTNIADTTNPNPAFTTFRNFPSINNDGVVAFWAGQGTQIATPQGIFTGTAATPPNTITTIADTNTFSDLPDHDLFSQFTREPDINDDGTVVFAAFYGTSGSGVVTGNGGPGSITTLYSNDGLLTNFTTDPSINNNGTVAFWAEIDSGGVGIFTGNGVNPFTTIVDSSGVFDVNIRRSPYINNDGMVVFSALLDAGGEGIFAGNGEAITTIANTNDGTFSAVGADPSINDAGTVAFQAGLAAGGSGIFTDNGGLITTLADSGPFTFFGGSPAINNNGMAAFSAHNIPTGIFTGPDPVADKVIQPGDLLFGSTLTNYEFGHKGLNDLGEIAFRYSLADGTKGIAVASPQQPIPEPSTLALLAIGVCGILGLSYQQQKKQRKDKSQQTTHKALAGI